MEILIVVAIWTVVVKRGVEDILHTARGGTPPRLAAAKARRSTGAAGRYWSALWDDVWTDLHNRHVAKRANPDRPRGAATVFWSNLWRDGWVSAERRRQGRTARPRPGQETVPGVVVPNAQDGDGDGDRPQDGDEPKPVPDEDGDRDEDGTADRDEPIVQPDPSQRDCRNCTPDRHWHDQYCLLVGDDLWIGEDEQDDHSGPDSGPDQDISPTAPSITQEGPTMTATTTEVVGLDSAIRFCEDSARAYRAQIQAIEQTQAALAAGDVTGPAAETFTQAMEQSNLAAASMDAAAAELLRHKQVQEAYLANQGAGTRDFILAGQ